MKATTPERLRRTAVEAVGYIPGIEAVVLFGSRARGTARATSDWDIAILSHASPENEHAAKRLFGDLERVESIVMNPESIEAHCNRGTRLESAIARPGKAARRRAHNFKTATQRGTGDCVATLPVSTPLGACLDPAPSPLPAAAPGVQ